MPRHYDQQPMRRRDVMRRPVHWLLSLLLIYSGTVKLLRFGAFAQTVRDFGIVFDLIVLPTALLVCLAELGLAWALWKEKSWALLATCAMLVVFLAVLIYGVSIGLDIECGCFGPAYQVDIRKQIAIDLALLATCILSHRYLPHRRKSVEAKN